MVMDAESSGTAPAMTFSSIPEISGMLRFPGTWRFPIAW